MLQPACGVLSTLLFATVVLFTRAPLFAEPLSHPLSVKTPPVNVFFMAGSLSPSFLPALPPHLSFSPSPSPFCVLPPFPLRFLLPPALLVSTPSPSPSAPYPSPPLSLSPLIIIILYLPPFLSFLPLCTLFFSSLLERVTIILITESQKLMR